MFLVAGIIMSYYSYMYLLKQEHLLYKADDLINTGIYKAMLMEIAINLI